MTASRRSLNLTTGLILTDTNAAPIEADGLTLAVRSLAEWLLSS
ncbi:MAG: hypothetical protein WAU95_09400 [Anaerolineae bacterium]